MLSGKIILNKCFQFYLLKSKQTYTDGCNTIIGSH